MLVAWTGCYTLALVHEETVENVWQLVERVLALTALEAEQEWWFRGQCRSSWPLVPSLYRRIPDVSQALEVERRVHLEFDNRSRMVAERAGARSRWELLFLAQHHRVPTRLLDWSRNLLIAAFFAANGDEAWADPGDLPCVLVLNPKQWNTKVLGPVGMTVAGPTGVIGDLTAATMGGYEPRTPGGVTGPDQEHAVAIAGPEFASRLVAQRGAFTVFGTKPADAAKSLEEQAEILHGAAGTALSKFKLEGTKMDWTRSLRLVGIGEFTVFPDLDGLAGELTTQHFPA